MMRKLGPFFLASTVAVGAALLRHARVAAGVVAMAKSQVRTSVPMREGGAAYGRLASAGQSGDLTSDSSPGGADAAPVWRRHILGADRSPLAGVGGST